ncbi:MAG: hypothetical protein AAF573_07310 [Bacteroidota bacterium]
MALRDDFPAAGVEYLGGSSDGWEYRTSFTGTTLKDSYSMVRKFLEEEGYENIPIPKNVNELLLFKNPKSQMQLRLFNERGYFHNPIKIFFPNGKRKEKTLVLCIYNEMQEGHLVRFHGVG